LLRALRGLLYDVKLFDLRVLVGAVAILFAVAILAAWIPADRASKIDPMVSLRHE
jgi:ABC-type antimicrobial peptide transport system permease subunit